MDEVKKQELKELLSTFDIQMALDEICPEIETVYKNSFKNKKREIISLLKLKDNRAEKIKKLRERLSEEEKQCEKISCYFQFLAMIDNRDELDAFFKEAQQLAQASYPKTAFDKMVLDTNLDRILTVLSSKYAVFYILKYLYTVSSATKSITDETMPFRINFMGLIIFFAKFKLGFNVSDDEIKGYINPFFEYCLTIKYHYKFMVFLKNHIKHLKNQVAEIQRKRNLIDSETQNNNIQTPINDVLEKENTPPTIFIVDTVREKVYEKLQAFFEEKDHKELSILLNGGIIEDKINFNGSASVFCFLFGELKNKQKINSTKAEIITWIAYYFDAKNKSISTANTETYVYGKKAPLKDKQIKIRDL